MRVNQQQLLLLSSTIREDNAFLSVDLTNLDSPVKSDDTLPRGTVHTFRLQFLREASCYQHIRLINYDRQPVRVSLFLPIQCRISPTSLKCAAQSARERANVCPIRSRETLRSPWPQGLGWRGPPHSPGVFALSPESLTTREAHFQITLEPKEEKSIFSTGTESRWRLESLDSLPHSFSGTATRF